MSNALTKKPESEAWAWWLAVTISALVVIWFYGLVPRYGSGREMDAFEWIYRSWNHESDYEHGIMFPFVIAGLIIYRLKDLKAAATGVDYRGLIVVLIGVLCYLAAYRTLQPRIAMGGFPIIMWGAAWFLSGWRVAKILVFPIFFFWLAIPLPSFQQATTSLQLIATEMSHHGSALFGVKTYVQGTTVLPVHGDWKPLDIAAGCSGIRSLMALLMISAAWAYIAKIAMWKRVLLFLSAVPLAILGNALRVISIFVIAEYGNAEWASTTWHDWSGLLLFYPFTLIILLLIHSVMEGGLPWNAARKRKLKRSVITRTVPPNHSIEESSSPS